VPAVSEGLANAAHLPSDLRLGLGQRFAGPGQNAGRDRVSRLLPRIWPRFRRDVPRMGSNLSALGAERVGEGLLQESAPTGPLEPGGRRRTGEARRREKLTLRVCEYSPAAEPVAAPDPARIRAFRGV